MSPELSTTAMDAERRRRRLRRIVARLGMYGLLVLVAVPFVFPVYWMFASGLKRYGDVFANPPALWPADPQWQNYVTPFVTTPFLRNFANSLYIATLVTIGVLIVASLAGYAFARIRFRGRNALFILLLTALLLRTRGSRRPSRPEPREPEPLSQAQEQHRFRRLR